MESLTEDDKWIYIDDELLNWMGYNCSDHYDNKKKYLKLLKSNFIENTDFKHIYAQEFKKSYRDLKVPNINTANKAKHLIIEPDTFKKSLMILQTSKAKEIQNYYITLEKIFKQKQEQEEQEKEEQENKQDKHNLLIEKFKYKKCIYISEVEENKLIKIGSSKDISYGLKYSWNQCLYLDIFECENFQEVELMILSNDLIKNNLYKESINGVTLLLNENFNYKQLISIIKSYICKMVFLTPTQQLENIEIEHNNKYNALNTNLNLPKIRSNGKKIQQIDPNNFNNIIKIHESMTELINSKEFKGIDRSSIYYAVRNNIIYKDFRWNIIEHDADVNTVNIQPTKLTEHKRSARVVETILKLNKEKTKIIDSYTTKSICAEINNLSRNKLRKILLNKEEYNNYYLILLSECPIEIINNSDTASIKFHRHPSSKSVIQINPINNKQIIFNTLNEATLNLDISKQTILKAIKNNTLACGFYWKLNI